MPSSVRKLAKWQFLTNPSVITKNVLLRLNHSKIHRQCIQTYLISMHNYISRFVSKMLIQKCHFMLEQVKHQTTVVDKKHNFVARNCKGYKGMLPIIQKIFQIHYVATLKIQWLKVTIHNCNKLCMEGSYHYYHIAIIKYF